MIPVPKPMTILLPSHICQVVAMISSMTPCYEVEFVSHEG